MKTVADLILTNGRITTLDPETSRGERKSSSRTDGSPDVDNAGNFQHRPQYEGHRSARPPRHSRPLRLAPARHSRRIELQHGAALGGRAVGLHRACKCCASRPPARRRPNGCAWSAVGASFNLPNGECQRSTKSTPPRPTRRCFILHLYCRALLNRAALRACGYTKDTPNPPGGEILRDKAGIPPACSSRARTRRSFTPRWPKARSFRRNINTIRRGISCGN